MASKVDVLGVLDFAAEMFGQQGWNTSANSLVESRAAVAELIAAADLMGDLMPDAELETDAVQGAIVARLRRAVSNVTGSAA